MAFSCELWRIMATCQTLECEEDHFDPVIKITNCLLASQMRVAFSNIESNTDSSSPGELVTSIFFGLNQDGHQIVSTNWKKWFAALGNIRSSSTDFDD
jgi:hypothetical protein